MNIFKYIAFAILVSSFAKIQAQCNLEETIIICEMTQIDGNNDGTLDGIINLYEEYTNLTGNTIQPGTWFDPGFNFALDNSTGDLYLWDLDSASETNTDYQFQLTNATCGTDEIALTINLILGPFSGFAVPTVGSNDVNVEICDEGIDPCGSTTMFDLNQALLSIPSAHTNGVWSYEGSSPNFLGIEGSTFLADVPYQPGVPLVDEETFELVYTVPGISPCTSPLAETRVKISVIREVFSGAANIFNICETELIAGNYGVIDLRDDAYLVNEDIEGIWLNGEDPTGQLSGPGDSIIDLSVLYNDLYQSNQRFGCETYDFSYFVESRSPVCTDKTSTVSFTFFEYIRPFSQVEPTPEFCVGDESINTFNLYSLLDFTTENGVLYDYPNDVGVTWSLVSGPSHLGLNDNIDSPCGAYAVNTSSGAICLSDLTNADAGTYTFEYSVSSDYNCPVGTPETIYVTPDGCASSMDTAHPCQSETAQVTIIIHPKNYAGEDTGVLAFCESSITSPMDLISLLTTNGIDDPIYVGDLGNWLDADSGNPIANPFTVPEINGQQTFNLVYNTTTENNCEDTADLSFLIYEEYQSGIGATLDICNDSTAFNLFDTLTGNPNTNGTWSGPNGFSATTNNVNFDPATFEVGDYIYTVPDNGNGADVICPGNQAIVTVNITQNANAGSAMQATLCRSDLQIDLLDLLDPLADLGGTFIDTDNTNALNGSIVDVSNFNVGSYNFEYQIQGSPLCTVATANIMVSIIDVDAPSAQNQTFCLIDAAKITDLEIDSSGFDFNWYDTATSTTILSEDELLINGEDYHVSVVDANGCESRRTPITVSLLALNDPSCDDCIINDGISDNDDNENEVLDLCNLPEVFPDYEIEIFNRYGTIVFKGNKNTPLFDGTSNVSLTLGDALPSGIYFYVFNPKDGNTEPFQGNVYLSR